jgi:hypothetical protein
METISVEEHEGRRILVYNTEKDKINHRRRIKRFLLKQIRSGRCPMTTEECDYQKYDWIKRRSALTSAILVSI